MTEPEPTEIFCPAVRLTAPEPMRIEPPTLPLLLMKRLPVPGITMEPAKLYPALRLTDHALASVSKELSPKIIFPPASIVSWPLLLPVVWERFQVVPFARVMFPVASNRIWEKPLNAVFTFKSKVPGLGGSLDKT